MTKLFCFGLGYSALALAKLVRFNGGNVSGTVRSQDKAKKLRADGIEAVVFDGTMPGPDVPALLKQSDCLLISISPDRNGDPVLAQHADDIAAARPKGVVYLSTIGVYGNHDGAWVDEETPTKPESDRAIARAKAESEWIAVGAMHDIPVMIFRLPGIYGPGRGPLEKLQNGTSKRIVKPGQVFNRIHVADIVRAVHAGLTRPRSGIFNICDNEPAPPQDVIAFAAHLMGIEPPPEVDFAETEMTPMARSFYSDNKRVSGQKAQRMLPYRLKYPTYREGIRALVEADKATE